MSNKFEPIIGMDVAVVSGPHEGRGGKLLQVVEDAHINGAHVALGEPYGIIEFAERDCFNDVHVDHVCVPIRRLSQRS